MKNIWTRGLGLLLCLSLTPLLAGQDGTKKPASSKNPIGNLDQQIPKDLLKEILEQDLDYLVDELGLAVAIDRIGQKLLRRCAEDKAVLDDKLRIVARYIGDDKIKEAAKLIAQPKINNELCEINLLSAEKRKAAISDFLTKHKLTLSLLKKGKVLVDLQDVIQGYQEDLNSSKKLLSQYMKSVPELDDSSSDDLQAALERDRKHLQAIQEERKRIEEMMRRKEQQAEKSLNGEDILRQFTEKK